MRDSTHTGDAAEAYIYYRLLSFGHKVHFANGVASPFDLWIDVDGEIIKIQVKGTSYLADKPGNRKSTYDFSTGKGGRKYKYDREDFDIIAYVALPCERAHFSDQVPGKSKKISPLKFDDDTEKRSWRKSLERAINRKTSGAFQKKRHGRHALRYGDAVW